MQLPQFIQYLKEVILAPALYYPHKLELAAVTEEPLSCHVRMT